MKLDSFFALREQLVNEWRGSISEKRGFAVEAEGSPLEASYRLAIGFSPRPGNSRRRKDVQVELRVQTRGSLAHMEARSIAERAKGEARIRIVENFRIPSIRELVDKTTQAQAAGAARFDPVPIGASISVAWGGTGTLGGFVRLTDDRIGFISNNHVLARMGSAKAASSVGVDGADRVYQPARGDVAYARARDQLGHLHDFVELDQDKSNTVDVAVGVLQSQRGVGGNVALASLGAPTDIALSQPRELLELIGEAASVRAAKIGRSTGYREGEITAISLDGLTVGTSVGDRVFNNVIEISSGQGLPFSAPGDSGAVVFDPATQAPFGLHFAGGRDDDADTYLSLSCSLPECLNALNLKWI